MHVGLIAKKVAATLKYEGVNSFLRKSYSYTKRKLGRSKINTNIYKDVLFINGCTLPHPTRYRVDHQIEQLHFNGYSCDSIYYEDLTLELVKYYRSFIFFRCPYTDVIGDFIAKAKYFNKTVFFDIDDLVIDYEYVKEIKYLKTMNESDFAMYMDGVNRMQKTLRMCDYATTTTTRLAKELEKYVPQVYVNRNVASEKMVELSQTALKKNLEAKDMGRGNDGRIILGYFSGSITHNDDVKLILPSLRKLFAKYPNVYLKIVGILDVPVELAEYKDRILTERFTDWTNLPKLIASVDINLAPLEESVFNEAKSENKWVEAALVKVVTISSNLGAFEEIITHELNGILCSSGEEWDYYLDLLVSSKKYRERLAEHAYKYVMENCTSAYTGYKLFEHIESHLPENIAFVLPSTKISGGVNVVVKHCHILRENGLDVTIISMHEDGENILTKDGEINVISNDRTQFHNFFHKCVSTLWSTNDFLNKYPKLKNRYYLVQNFETNFYEPGHVFKIWANLTYNSFNQTKYITISTWCKNWLKEKFNKEAGYARNGIDLAWFPFKERDFTGKIRILVEGNSTDYYKNVDESFNITARLDPNKFEIWYLSYHGKPKEWYRVDKFLHKVPHEDVGAVYGSCHILLKSSLLESFSYPPLEMMATGGIAIVAPNEGNIEYLEHNYNCLLYQQGDIESSVNMINLISEDQQLRKKIIANGYETAQARQWDKIETEILHLYGVVKNV